MGLKREKPVDKRTIWHWWRSWCSWLQILDPKNSISRNPHHNTQGIPGKTGPWGPGDKTVNASSWKVTKLHNTRAGTVKLQLLKKTITMNDYSCGRNMCSCSRQRWPINSWKKINGLRRPPINRNNFFFWWMWITWNYIELDCNAHQMYTFLEQICWLRCPFSVLFFLAADFHLPELQCFISDSQLTRDAALHLGLEDTGQSGEMDILYREKWTYEDYITGNIIITHLIRTLGTKDDMY